VDAERDPKRIRVAGELDVDPGRRLEEPDLAVLADTFDEADVDRRPGNDGPRRRTRQRGGTSGRRVFRAEGSGAFVFVKDVGTASTWTDYMTMAGQSYSYKAVGYNQSNVASSTSSVATITPLDTTPPPAPGVPTGTVSGTTIILTPPLPCTHDLAGLNVHISQISGGPYTKLNNSPISVGVRPVTWTQAGFQPNHVYYIVLTSVDFSGNESGYSPEFVTQTGS